MKLVTVFSVFIGLIIVVDHSQAIRPIIRLRPKIVLGKSDLLDGEDDSLNKIYRSIAKTVISGYLFGALRRPFGLPMIGSWVTGGGWDGVSPLSVTFAVGGKRPGYQGDSGDHDKSPRVEKIKIIEKEKEKPVKHIVISHKIIGPPASSISVTGGHLMPGMLEESAMAAIGSEMSSPWSETQTKYSTLDSSGSSSLYGLPVDSSKKVKIVKIKETTSDSGDDEEEYTSDDEDESSRDYRVVKRQVYSYKDKSTDESQPSRYGYKPSYEEQTMAESTQAHVIRMENSTEETDYTTDNPIQSTSTPAPSTITSTIQTSTTKQTITRPSTNKTISSTKRKVNQSSTTVSPLTTVKTFATTNKTIKVDSINSTASFSKRSIVKVIKEPVVTTDDPWLDYLNQKEAQESQLTNSKQSKLVSSEPAVNNTKTRKNINRNQSNRKSKKSQSKNRSRNQYNYDPMSYSLDEQLTNLKINSVKAFADGWVSRRRHRNKSKSNRRRSSKSRSKKNQKKSKYRVINLPNLSSTDSLPFNPLIALPSSSGPIVFPTTIKRSLLESNPILMPPSMFNMRSSFSL